MALLFAPSTPTQTGELNAVPTAPNIFPDLAALPANLLRLYVEFPVPMQRGMADRGVRLLAGGVDGTPIEGAFLRIGQELWSPNMQRLTLMLDPGRIKTGLAPNDAVGAPLSALALGGERRATLVVSDILTADGGTVPPFMRTFAVGPNDRTGPDPARWTLSPIAPGTNDPLVVAVTDPLDPALAIRLVRVEDKDGSPVPAIPAMSSDGRSIAFTPQTAWPEGRLRIAVHPALEDPSGNRVNQTFDMPPGSVRNVPTSAIIYKPVILREAQ